MNYKEEFSKRLIHLREQNGFTQQQLADKLQITRQSLSLYEKAERTINIELLAKIADFFNASTDYLMGRTDIITMDEDIQVACKVTGLREPVIEHINYLSNFFDDKYFAFVLEHFILGIDHSILFSIEDYYIAKQEAYHYEQYIIKKFCEYEKLNISDNDIEEKGLNAIEDILHQAKCKGLIDAIFIRLNIDVDYKKYVISKNIQNIFLSIDACDLSEEIAKKADTFDNNKKARLLNIMNKLLKEASENAEHNSTKE